MSLARVVTFSGVSSERIEELKREIDEGEQPEGLNPSEMVMLHDPGSSEAIAISSSTAKRTTSAGTRCSTPCRRPRPRGSGQPSSATRSRFGRAGSQARGTELGTK